MKLKDDKYGYAKSFYVICTVLQYSLIIAAVVQIFFIAVELISETTHINILYNNYVELFDIVVILFLLKIIRKILVTAKEGNPFVFDNIKQLRLLGGIYIGASVVLGTLPPIFHLAGLVELKEIINLIKNNSFIITSGGFITGFIFLFIAEVFEVGLKLKKENELTV